MTNQKKIMRGYDQHLIQGFPYRFSIGGGMVPPLRDGTKGGGQLA